jgi:hypothetical protein
MSAAALLLAAGLTGQVAFARGDPPPPVPSAIAPPDTCSRSSVTDFAVRVSPHRVRFERIEQWQLRRRFDCGPVGPPAAGTIRFDTVTRNPWIAWGKGMVRSYRRDGGNDPFLADGAEGSRASLLVGVVPGKPLRLLLTLGDLRNRRGPVDITVDGMNRVQDVETGAGEFVDVDIQGIPSRPVLEIRLDAGGCDQFSLAGVALFGLGPSPRETPPGGAPGLGAGAPSPLRVDRDSLEVRAQCTLGRICDYLLDESPSEGGFSREGNWYECAYPVRALLLGWRLLGKERYRDAALECVDRFVAERLPDGSWGAHYFGGARCETALSTRDEGKSRNLADLGSMALVLPIAAAADPTRRDAYLRAAQAYADSVVLPAQLESGAFPDLVFEGVDYRHPYSVATGLQGAFLAALAGSTGAPRYRDAAERAGLYLSRDFELGGAVRFHPYDRDTVLTVNPERMGDLFYVLEGMLWIERESRPDVREEVLSALDRFFLAPAVRDRWEHPDSWLLAGNGWEVSKRAGILYLLASYAEERKAAGEALSPDLLRQFAIIEDLAWGSLLGIQASPDSPRGRYAMLASGFAGLGTAALLAPGSPFRLAP